MRLALVCTLLSLPISRTHLLSLAQPKVLRSPLVPQQREPSTRAIPIIGSHLNQSTALEVDNAIQTCRSQQTEVRNYGAIRLIDIGDDVDNLAEFLGGQARQCSERRERCLVAAYLPGCPSCAIIGHSMLDGSMARMLGPLTLVRIDVDEFDQELRQLGLDAAEVPVLARLSDSGSIGDTLDPTSWSNNSPTSFLSALRDFVEGRAVRPRGGRGMAEKRAFVRL